jgi:hypothetical protein
VYQRLWWSVVVQTLVLMDGGPRKVVFDAYHGLLDTLLTDFETTNVTIEAEGAVLHMWK